MALIGYARVSTPAQSLELQTAALVGCDRVFTDTAGGAAAGRPGLVQALAYLRTGDTLKVWKLDRLGRTVAGLIDLARDLGNRGVNLVSVTEGIDTTTPAGRLMFHLLASLAQMERELTRERTLAGLQAARALGRRGGRPRISAKALRAATELFAAGRSAPDVAELLGVSVTSLYRRLPPAARQVDFVRQIEDSDNRSDHG